MSSVAGKYPMGHDPLPAELNSYWSEFHHSLDSAQVPAYSVDRCGAILSGAISSAYQYQCPECGGHDTITRPTDREGYERMDCRSCGAFYRAIKKGEQDDQAQRDVAGTQRDGGTNRGT